MRPSLRKRVIFTADDFGLHTAVNEAVEQAAREGVLTTASLMVGEKACADAIHRAKGLRQLKVGLHVALADATPVLSPDEIPDLVDEHGRFGLGMARVGVRFFFLPHVRRQLAAEIRAQFQAFADTGLALDHVNAHKHFHLHPTVLGMMLSIGREFGIKAVRLPHEPLRAGLRVARDNALGKLAWAGFITPWTGLMKARLVRAGIDHNDALFGLAASGRMDESAVLTILANLPRGVTELYLHPATLDGISESMSEYAHVSELAALTSPRVRAALERDAIDRISFTDLVAESHAG